MEVKKEEAVAEKKRLHWYHHGKYYVRKRGDVL